jgi:hypothetical protein
VQSNPAYLLVILLARVITRLGSLEHINPKVIESLYAADLAYLQSSMVASMERVATGCAHAAPIARKSSKWSLNRRGSLALPLRAAPRGGSIHCISFSLAAHPDHAPRACRAPMLGRRDREDQPSSERGGKWQ